MLQPSGLVDSGALLALLNRRDRWHQTCREVLPTLSLPLATSVAVVTELSHFIVSRRLGPIEAMWRLLRSDAITVLPITDQDLPELELLMRQYGDRPMDFADATLVHLAQRESLDTIFTIDHADFETYRIRGRHPFRIVPERHESR